LILSIIDQGASSLSNFALAILVAHYSGARELGIFAILTSTYVLSQGLVRSLTSDCLLTRSETDDGIMSRFERAGFWAALVVATLLAVALLALGGILSDSYTIFFVIFALAFPLMALQDFSRFIGISRHDPAYAIRLDVAWLVLFLLAYLGLRSAGLTSVPWLFGAWCAAGALVGLTTLRSNLRRGAKGLLEFWVNSERAVGTRFASQFMLVTSWSYVIFYLLVFVISIEAIGLFKLSQLALGPIAVMAAGIQAPLIALAAKRFQVNTRKAVRFLLLAGVAIAVVTLLWTAVVYFAPLHTMTALLGTSWPQARALVPFNGLAFALAGFSGAAFAGLRALRAAKENLRVALIMLPFQFVLCMGGAAMWGARGAVMGLSVGSGMCAVLSWTVLVRTVARFEQRTGDRGVVVEVANP
jgi:O-antigen/teichoic acid export membrane protein